MFYCFRMFVNKRFIMMMNCFCGMVNRQKAVNPISSRDHSQRSSPSRISDTPRAGFEHAQNLSSGFVEWSCAVVITITPQRHFTSHISHAHISKSKRSFNVKSSTYYFHMKTKILADFQIWISVLLSVVFFFSVLFCCAFCTCL